MSEVERKTHIEMVGDKSLKFEFREGFMDGPWTILISLMDTNERHYYVRAYLWDMNARIRYENEQNILSEYLPRKIRFGMLSLGIDEQIAERLSFKVRNEFVSWMRELGVKI